MVLSVAADGRWQEHHDHGRFADMTFIDTGTQPMGGNGLPPRIAMLAADELTARRIDGALAAVEMTIATTARDIDTLVDAPEADVLIGVFGRGLTARDSQLRALSKLLDRTAVVAIMPADSRRGVRRALEAGARGVVFESQLEAALAPTVTAVLAGQVAVPAAERDQFERPALSFREKEILGLIVLGMSNKEISARLFLAESTVKCHLSSAFGKLGVRSRNEAADLILNEGAELGLADLASPPIAAEVR